MDIFTVIVGLFSIAAAIAAIASFFQAKKAKEKSALALSKIERIEAYIQSQELKGGNIQVGGEMKVGGSVRAHGGVAINETTKNS